VKVYKVVRPKRRWFTWAKAGEYVSVVMCKKDGWTQDDGFLLRGRCRTYRVTVSTRRERGSTGLCAFLTLENAISFAKRESLGCEIWKAHALASNEKACDELKAWCPGIIVCDSITLVKRVWPEEGRTP
jgi:hypothetical protein